MKLVSMKRSKKEQDSDGVEIPKTKVELYGYGLRVDLETNELEKLGLGVKSFDIGKKVELVCRAEVVSTSISADKADKRESVSLQITDLGIKGVKDGKFQEYAKDMKRGPGE